jgi:hypothetical protein
VTIEPERFENLLQVLSDFQFLIRNCTGKGGVLPETSLKSLAELIGISFS